IGGRHPLVEAALGPGRFVPNNVRLGADCTVVLLSGPNMAGKSTYLRQAGIIVLLAQVGSFVPAERAVIGLCDRIFTRVGAHDELARGLSTFMVEMVETAHILAHATPRSLLIFDEVGRGTSTYDGVSIAQAILEYVHEAPQLQSLTLFATHYHELTALAQRLPRLRNFRMEVREEGERVIFLHQVVEGGADRSYGIHVAELAGLPRQIVVRARQVLSELEGQRPLERPAASAQLSLPLDHPVVAELKQLDLERLSPREALDDGQGMQPEDLPVAFARHATSKLRALEELRTIRTLGFRGEALASIAAVAQVEAVSRRRDGGEGFRVRIRGGELLTADPVG